MPSLSLYHRQRFPAEIISHCVWLSGTAAGCPAAEAVESNWRSRSRQPDSTKELAVCGGIEFLFLLALLH